MNWPRVSSDAVGPVAVALPESGVDPPLSHCSGVSARLARFELSL